MGDSGEFGEQGPLGAHIQRAVVGSPVAHLATALVTQFISSLPGPLLDLFYELRFFSLVIVTFGFVLLFMDYCSNF